MNDLINCQRYVSRSSDVISNASSGVPLKSPAQKEVKSGLESGE